MEVLSWKRRELLRYYDQHQPPAPSYVFTVAIHKPSYRSLFPLLGLNCIILITLWNHMMISSYIIKPLMTEKERILWSLQPVKDWGISNNFPVMWGHFFRQLGVALAYQEMVLTPLLSNKLKNWPGVEDFPLLYFLKPRMEAQRVIGTIHTHHWYHLQWVNHNKQRKKLWNKDMKIYISQYLLILYSALPRTQKQVTHVIWS